MYSRVRLQGLRVCATDCFFFFAYLFSRQLNMKRDVVNRSKHKQTAMNSAFTQNGRFLVQLLLYIIIMKSSKSFQDKVVVVTGAGKGIGKGICQELVRQGAKVVAISRTKEDLDELKGCYKTIQADLGIAEQCLKAAEDAGDVDYLINNAAVAVLESFLETKLESFITTMKVNVEAPLLMSQVIAKNMIKKGVKGSIVNISSQASKVGLQNHVSYCASKGALDQMTRVMALELGEYGIRVNAVNPTVIMTKMAKIGWSDEKKAAGMLSHIPLGKFGEIEDVVNATLFLLTAEMITGHCLPVDGGFLASPFSLHHPKV